MGPVMAPTRDNFVSWLYHLNIPTDENWLLLGDFNFIRSFDNRNIPGGDVNDFLFNEIIGHLGLLELPLKGRSFTWSNMQENPLLEQLDWFFTTSDWISIYPNTVVLPLAKTSSDHVPCVVSIDTNIPKTRVFRFENYWLTQSTFKDIVKNAWDIPAGFTEPAKIINAKLKHLRRSIKLWIKDLPCMRKQIAEINECIYLLDFFEEFRVLSTFEWNC